MSDYLIHSGKLGMKWYQHDKDAYQTKSGNWVYGRNKPSGSRNLKIASPTGGKTISVDGKLRVSNIDDIMDDVAKTNAIGKYSKYNPSRNQNCMSCAIAYDLRRAGNKVQAIETAEGISAFVVADIYKNTKTTDYVISAKRIGTFKSSTKGMKNSEFDSMINYLKSDGENTRGIVVANWKSKHGKDYIGSHAMNYEVKNGKFYLIDGQTSKVYDEQSARKKLSNMCDVMTLRTDNRQVNLDYAKSYFVEPEGTKTSDVGKGLHTAQVINKVSRDLRKAGGISASALMGLSGLSAITPALFIAAKAATVIGVGGNAVSVAFKTAAPVLSGLSAITPTLFIAAKASTVIGIGGFAVSVASKIAVKKIIQNNQNKTAANIIEKLTGDKVDPKTRSANLVRIMKRLPEYKRIYQMETGDEYADDFEILSNLKTTDSYNTTNRNRDPIPAPSPTDRNTSIGISSSQKGSMKSLYAKGVPIDEIAEKLGVSPSTVFKYVK